MVFRCFLTVSHVEIATPRPINIKMSPSWRDSNQSLNNEKQTHSITSRSCDCIWLNLNVCRLASVTYSIKCSPCQIGSKRLLLYSFYFILNFTPLLAMLIYPLLILQRIVTVLVLWELFLTPHLEYYNLYNLVFISLVMYCLECSL